MAEDKTIARFRKSVFSYYKTHGRHTLPWRKTHNPYKILVSEVMLQQTQVERVIPYYKAWIKKYPTHTALAAAPLSDVLRLWQGLGYNRRAKNLHLAAKTLVSLRQFPRTPQELEALPGIGSYTACAILCFSYNHDEVCIETNIRTATLFHFFSAGTNKKGKGISDNDLLHVLKKALPRGRGREWHYALMDYGAHLKRRGVRLHRRMKEYKKQPAFKGSSREVRGAIVKALSQQMHAKARLARLFGGKRKDQVERQIDALLQEGMIEKKGQYLSLPTS